MGKKIGLWDCDSHNFPNLALMKISAWHKQQGDDVEWWLPLFHYDKVYVSKVFGDEYSTMDLTCIDADEIEYGGTGFAITVENGKEVYHKELDKPLPYEIEHIYPDYSLYPELTKDTAYGFLTRGCCNNCDFCIVSKKEGKCSTKVADLNEWWNGQKKIELLDSNILACKDRLELLDQLIKSEATVSFTGGIDARFINDEIAEKLSKVKTSILYFAFDFMKNEKAVIKGLECFKKYTKLGYHNLCCYVLTNYDTNFSEDLYRIETLIKLGYSPYIMIYRKQTAPRFIQHLQRWCNNRFLMYKMDFNDYMPTENSLPMKQQYKDIFEEYEKYKLQKN